MVETIVEAELALQAFVDAVVGDLVTDRGTDIDAWYASIKDDDPVERLVKLYNALDSADQRTRHGAAERMGRGYNAARTEFFRKYNELVEAKVNLALEAEKDPIKITRLLLTTTIEKQALQAIVDTISDAPENDDDAKQCAICFEVCKACKNQVHADCMRQYRANAGQWTPCPTCRTVMPDPQPVPVPAPVSMAMPILPPSPIPLPTMVLSGDVLNALRLAQNAMAMLRAMNN